MSLKGRSLSTRAADGTRSELPTAYCLPPTAFSFVHAITDLVPGRRARGRLSLAEGITLPPCLAAEAVGQLAAWMAMAACDFTRRPVAGIAGEVVFGAGDGATGSVELEVELETCDDDAVVYRGRASAGGTEVVSLKECVGPMLPAKDFDDPHVLRERFDRLVAAPGPKPLATLSDFSASCTVREIACDPGKRLVAELRVPAQAPFFADHFPRKPVFPATLFLDAQIRLALALEGGSRSKIRVRGVKMRSFISPGDVIEVTAELTGPDVRLTARSGGRRLSTATVLIESERA